MYKLAPYFPADVTVSPKKVIYNLPGYHHDLPSVSPSSFEEVDPVKLLELKQLELIELLGSQTTKLAEFLSSKGGKAKAEKPSNEKKTTTAPETVVNEEKDGKKGKDAKRDARKAAKNEAKNKIATGEQPKGGKPAQGSSSDGPAWTVSEEKKTTESGQSLTANLKPVLAQYAQEVVGEVNLTVTEADIQWVKLLAQLASKKNVSFTGLASNNVKNAKSTFAVGKGPKVVMTLGKVEVHSRTTIWKLIGSALGLFSNQPQHAISSTHQHLWFAKADSILEGRLTIEQLRREASQFLSRFDSLSATFDLTLVDFVVLSFLTGMSKENNIQLWASRVSCAL